MDAEELAGRIDHTVLGPRTTAADVESVIDEAGKYGTNACIPPCYVAEASASTTDVRLVTVVGFPHGQHSTEVKVAEAVDAWDAGADELDVVVALGRLAAGDDDAVRADVANVVAAVPVPVKAIVEAPLLGDDELERACAVAKEAGADYVKTATGFAGGGASVGDVEVMSRYLPVKASGGIRSWADARAMFEAGAERIGASAGGAIVEDFLSSVD